MAFPSPVPVLVRQRRYGRGRADAPEERRPLEPAPAPTSLLERVVGLLWGTVAVTAPLNGLRVFRSFTICEVLLAAAVAATVASRTLSRRTIDATAYRSVLAGLALVTAGGLLATGFGPGTGASLLGTLSFVSATAGSLVALILWAPSRNQLRWFCALWLAGAVVSSMWGLVASERVVGRGFGLASHPNSLGLVCVLATGLALGFAAAAGGSRLSRYVAGASLLALIGGLFSSGSRAALLGVVSAVPAVALLCSRRRAALVSAVAAAAVGVAVLVGVVETPDQGRVGRFTGDASTVQSDALRLEQLHRSFELIGGHPVTGAGFEFADEVHSIYLQSLVAAGPLGLMGLLVATWSVVVVVGRCLATEGKTLSGDHALLAGLAGGYVGYLVAGAFQNSLSARYMWVYLAGMLALACDLHRNGSSTSSAASTRHTCDGPMVRFQRKESAT